MKKQYLSSARAQKRHPFYISLADLSSTQTDVEKMEIFGSFRGKAGAVHQRSRGTEEAEVVRQSQVAVRVSEVTVTVAQPVVLESHK